MVCKDRMCYHLEKYVLVSGHVWHHLAMKLNQSLTQTRKFATIYILDCY
jgi:hypothetical protein